MCATVNRNFIPKFVHRLYMVIHVERCGDVIAEFVTNVLRFIFLGFFWATMSVQHFLTMLHTYV